MFYSLNAGDWNSVFAVPSSVVDNYIKLASGNSLKLLLYLLRHGGEKIPGEKLAEELGFTEMGELEDAALFWVQRGIIRYNGADLNVLSPAAPTADKPPAPVEKPTVKNVELPKPVKVSAGEIASRIQDNEEIKFLFNEAQRLYGRMLRQSEEQLLISLTDHYGLSGAVSAMLLGFCFKNGQTAPSYISAVAKNWAEEEITSVELANAKIRALEKQNAVEERLRRAMGMKSRMTSKMRNFIDKWTNEWGFGEEMIMLAYEKTVNQISEWKPEYANKILESWNAEGLRTSEAVEKSETAYRQSMSKKQSAESSGKSSFNVDSVMSELKNRYKNGT